MLGGLQVHSEKMMRNLKMTDGLVNSEAVMMALAPKMRRSKAHDRISAVCIAVSEEKRRFIDLLAADVEISRLIDRSELEKLFHPTTYLGSSGKMVDRVLNQG